MKSKQLKALIVAAAITAAAVCIVLPTGAYLAASSNDAVNQFSNAFVTCAIKENFNGQTKTDVQIQNTGNIPAFIRSELIVTWRNAAGQIHWQQPQAETDYTMVLDLTGGWSQRADGYYYWNAAVEPQAYTGILVTSCEPVANQAPEGFRLSVEIMADAIQTEPLSAVQEAWGIVPGEGQVSGK